MEVIYRREMNHNYAVLQGEEPYEEEDYQIRMLISNKIMGLLKLNLRNLDNKPDFYYDISSRQSIHHIFERKKAVFNDLKSIIIGIAKTVEQAREYLLDLNHIVLTPELIFLNPEEMNPEFCYCPLYEKEFSDGLSELIQYLLEKTDHTDKDGVLFVYGMYRISQNDNYTIEEIMSLIHDADECNVEEEQEERIDAIQERPVVTYPKEVLVSEGNGFLPLLNYKLVLLVITDIITYATVILFYVYYDGFEKEYGIMGFWTIILLLTVMTFYAFYYMKKKQTDTNDFGHKEVIPYSPESVQDAQEPESGLGVELFGDTVLLGYQENKEVKTLISIESKEIQDIIISDVPCLIGKLERKVDFVILDPMISRIHAKISMDNNEYFIEDYNSTNGTYLNEQRLEAFEKAKMKDGDRVRFAGITFLFQ